MISKIYVCMHALCVYIYIHIHNRIHGEKRGLIIRVVFGTYCSWGRTTVGGPSGRRVPGSIVRYRTSVGPSNVLDLGMFGTVGGWDLEFLGCVPKSKTFAHTVKQKRLHTCACKLLFVQNNNMDNEKHRRTQPSVFKLSVPRSPAPR